MAFTLKKRINKDMQPKEIIDIINDYFGYSVNSGSV